MEEYFSQYSDQEAQRIARLIAGFIRGTLSRSEHQELDDWVAASDENMQLFEKLTDEKNIEAATRWMQGVETEKALEKHKESMVFNKAATGGKWLRLLPYAGAASVLLVLALFIFRQTGKKNTLPEVVKNNVTDILPGDTRASLTLEDGKVILLDNVVNDTSINGQVKISKQIGEIKYEGQSDNMNTAYHTLTIPRKGHYKLVLPDGTNVWLNAASSIRYPIVFAGTERKVFITGEAYFEVAKDKTKPFRVAVDEMLVEALGTAFNINAYTNEPFISTTLAEGSVLVTKGNMENVLRPGQQAQVSATNLTVSAVEASDVIAWKDNQFRFVNTPLEVIMRQVERWYDAEVVYESKPTDHFNAEISRDVPVSRLLHILELTHRVHFKIENNKIIVMK